MAGVKKYAGSSPARRKEKEQMSKKRAVAYIRVSTEKDAQLHSYDFQEQYWRGVFDDDT